MTIRHVVSVSGGKDSTATLLIALERFGRERVTPIFCDTGNEHQAVYDYLAYLEAALDVRIERLRADFSGEFARKRMFIARDQRTGRDDRGRRLRWSNRRKHEALAVLQPTGNPFLDLCLLKGRFPSRTAQFCTERLKRDPAVEFQLALIDAGYHVVSWQGIRRDESQRRRNALRFERLAPRLDVYRPIVDWTAQQVFEFCAARGVRPNPLYLQGMGRVGCMPCINAGKAEIAEIARRFPEHVERIAAWERLVSAGAKRGFTSFFHKVEKPGTDREQFERNRVESVVMWARTTRGGMQFDLLEALAPSAGCASSYGLCEAAS